MKSVQKEGRSGVEKAVTALAAQVRKKISSLHRSKLLFLVSRNLLNRDGAFAKNV